MSEPTGSPGPGDSVLPRAEVLGAGAPERRRHGRHGLVVGGAVVAVTAAAGGAFALAAYLSGGGVQPEDVMPAGVLAYADLDLDPPAGQKANVVRLAAKFSDVDSRLGEAGGLRSVVLDRLLSGTAVDPASVEAWLGDRFGVGLLSVAGGQSPPDGAVPGTVLPGIATPEPGVVVAIQVTDEAAARTWLTDQLDGDGTVTVTQGYALVASPGVDLDQVVSDTEAGSLGDSPAFRDAVDPLGDGVAQAYLDLPALADAVSGLGLLGVPGAPEVAGASGPAGFVLRVEPDAVEVRGAFAASGDAVGSTPTRLAAGLPDSTGFVVASSGLGQALADRWAALLGQASDGLSPGQVDRELRRVERSTGLALPEDLVTILGDDLVLAVDGTDLVTAPQAGIRVATDPAEAARLVDVVAPLVAEATGGYGFDLQPTADGYVAATSAEYARLLAAGSGGFLDDPQVQAALPDADSAGQLLYLDFGAVRSAAESVDPQAAPVLAPLRALGATGTLADGRWTLRLRLTVQ